MQAESIGEMKQQLAAAQQAAAAANKAEKEAVAAFDVKAEKHNK